MEEYIQISKLNDFIFCPYSLYLHSIYDGFNSETYHARPQKVGKIHHESIDNATYSSAKRYLQGISVYSDMYKLAGKIDIYDFEKRALVDRKYKIKQIFDGYKYQLYGQYFGMHELGYDVDSLFLHSLSDNKRYEIDLPVGAELKRFNKLIRDIRAFYKNRVDPDVPIEKCQNCIYNSLCIYAKSA